MVCTNVEVVEVEKGHPNHALSDEVVGAFLRSSERSLRGSTACGPRDRDEVGQDLAVRLLGRLQSYRPRRGSIRPWAKVAVRSCARDAVRAARRRRMRNLPDVESLDDVVIDDGREISAGDIIPSRVPGPDERVIASETRERVSQVLANLPARLQALCFALVDQTKGAARLQLGLSRRTFDSQLDELKHAFTRAGLGEICPNARRDSGAVVPPE